MQLGIKSSCISSGEACKKHVHKDSGWCLGWLRRLSVRCFRPTPTRPSTTERRRRAAARPGQRPHTHRARASDQVSARVRVRASVRVIRLARPLCSLPSGTPLVPTPAGRRTLRHIVSSHVRQDAIVVDLAVDFALADELVSLSG